MTDGSYRAQYGLFAFLRRFWSVALVATSFGIVWIAAVFILAAFFYPAHSPQKTFVNGMGLYLFYSAAFFATVYGQYLSPAATNGRSESYFFLHMFLSWCWAAAVVAICMSTGVADFKSAFIPLWFITLVYVVFCPLMAIGAAYNTRSNHPYFFGYSSPTLLFGDDPDFLADLRLAYEERQGDRSYRYW